MLQRTFGEAMMPSSNISHTAGLRTENKPVLVTSLLLPYAMSHSQPACPYTL